MNEPGYFDIEQIKADYLKARCTPFHQVKDVARFLESLGNLRRYLILEIGEESVKELDRQAQQMALKAGSAHLN